MPAPTAGRRALRTRARPRPAPATPPQAGRARPGRRAGTAPEEPRRGGASAGPGPACSLAISAPAAGTGEAAVGCGSEEHIARESTSAGPRPWRQSWRSVTLGEGDADTCKHGRLSRTASADGHASTPNAGASRREPSHRHLPKNTVLTHVMAHLELEKSSFGTLGTR
ncbi:translation initiation factor IF-2-like [Lemur catta]|uniref:translation initiation factor IF-2-like n=1 Tax=Lemur catta TaxID=9447 RepID=UPI001E26CE24|nr:translation initiation factor IF-2-like [Lemur catta]